MWQFPTDPEQNRNGSDWLERILLKYTFKGPLIGIGIAIAVLLINHFFIFKVIGRILVAFDILALVLPVFSVLVLIIGLIRKRSVAGSIVLRCPDCGYSIRVSRKFAREKKPVRCENCDAAWLEYPALDKLQKH